MARRFERWTPFYAIHIKKIARFSTDYARFEVLNLTDPIDRRKFNIWQNSTGITLRREYREKQRKLLDQLENVGELIKEMQSG